ncbi:MAG: RNA-directed DNA polymerase [Alphaproteobacteria bacterium]|nr:RNA-directed DNA polymerase [Alphaproteobacteria bacterium]
MDKRLELEPESEPLSTETSAEDGTNISLLNLSASEARNFLLKGSSYCEFDLPIYFKFDDLINKVSKAIKNKNLSDFQTEKPHKFEGLNYTLFNNKDSKYAWRPLQLIHPALYVSLVHSITNENNWNIIIERFKKFRKLPNIECASIPVKSLTKNSDKAEQISHWINETEKKSIELALDYEYLIHTDISDCYGSIYTHSIAWAIHGKKYAKNNRSSIIGNNIDQHLQNMSYGQTNGIPQGSILMDFIAEIVLGYIDMQLHTKIKACKDYHIIRYRDDYRIFVNNPKDGEKIVKYLSEILINFGMKLNPHKTNTYSDTISNSINNDKLSWINKPHYKKNLLDQLLLINNHSNNFTNAGSLMAPLEDVFERIINVKSEDIIPMISIVTNIAYNNPKTYKEASAILSKLIDLLDNNQKQIIIRKIIKKFTQIPNTGYLQLWLQRITIKYAPSIDYEEKLCKTVNKEDVTIWKSNWLNNKLNKIINECEIIDYNQINNLPNVIQKEEIELFKSKY